MLQNKIVRKLTTASIGGLLLLALASCTPYASGSQTPTWPAPSTDIVAHAKGAGLQILTKEGTVLHIHTHLTITLNGNHITVPANVGIDTKKKLYSELHTHDTSGIIHVEAGEKKTFYLEQFFNEWGIPLGAHTVGGYSADKNKTKISFWVNRKLYTGDYTKLALTSRTDLIIAITTDGSTPKISAAFKWPKGYTH